MKNTNTEQNEPILSAAVQEQMGLLNFRIKDMMTQLNSVIKSLVDENAALKRENAKLAPVNPQRESKSKSHSDTQV